MPANRTKTPTSKTPAPVITSRQAQMAYKATRKDYPTLRPHMPLYFSHKPATYTPATFALRLADIIAMAVNEERDEIERQGN